MTTPSAETNAAPTTTTASPADGAPATPGGTTPAASPTAAAPSGAEAKPKRERVVGPALSTLTKQEREFQAAKQAFEADVGRIPAPVLTALKGGDIVGAVRELVKMGGDKVDIQALVDAVAPDADGEEELTPEQIAAKTVEAKLKERDEAEQAAKEQAIAEGFERAKTNYRKTLQSTAEADKGKYDVANAFPELLDEALEAAVTLAEESGETLGHGAALERAEAALETQLVEMVTKAMGTRLGARLVALVAEAGKKQPPKEAADPKKSGRAAEPTLNNRNASGVPPLESEEEVERLTPGQRLKRAAAKAGIQLGSD